MSYLELPALKVIQPLGDFFIIKLSPEELLSISFSEPMAYINERGQVKGSQRKKDEKRLTEIARYIDSVEMAFPNSIILAANYTQLGTVSMDESERWRIEENTDCGIVKIIIPKKIKLAAIIDGQHRLNAFEYVTKQERFTDLQLVCSVYFDLPNSYQAFLFATINSNQKKVDRSLALEQFGFNVDDEPEKAWTPEKLAVFISRKLNIDSESPFCKHIKVAPLNPENLFNDDFKTDWVVSTATIVDGILSLISSNPKRDRIDMQQKSILTGRNREMILNRKDLSPMRHFFVKGNDQIIYDCIKLYFNSVKTILWSKAQPDSYILKTVGIQALFDILKMILKRESTSNPKEINFAEYINPVRNINFSDPFFQASGIGRSRIRNLIGIASEIINVEKIKSSEREYYEKLLNTNSTNGSHEKMAWIEEAENAIINALAKAEWDIESKRVKLYSRGDYESPVIYDSYNRFFGALINIAEEAFVSSLPGDSEIANELSEQFHAEDLVETYLVDFEEYLKEMKWW